MKKKKEEDIAKIIDKDFLNKLVEVAKIYGWNGDYAEICTFIKDLHEVKNIKIGNDDLDPYDSL